VGLVELQVIFFLLFKIPMFSSVVALQMLTMKDFLMIDKVLNSSSDVAV
jgi:hypothetical protein